jgi:polyisoprenoid-binding protein YceI
MSAVHTPEFTMALLQVEIPGYVVGLWNIDPVHSYAGFVVKHSMVSRVRGQFELVQGEIVTALDIVESTVHVSIEVASFHTNNEVRNEDIRSLRFMDAEHFPTMTFRSTGIRLEDGFVIEGDLTVKGVTKPVVIQASTPKFGASQQGGTSVGISGHTAIHKSEFGVDFNMAIPGGGWVLGDDIEVILEIEATLQE